MNRYKGWNKYEKEIELRPFLWALQKKILEVFAGALFVVCTIQASELLPVGVGRVGIRGKGIERF